MEAITLFLLFFLVVLVITAVAMVGVAATTSNVNTLEIVMRGETGEEKVSIIADNQVIHKEIKLPKTNETYSYVLPPNTKDIVLHYSNDIGDVIVSTATLGGKDLLSTVASYPTKANSDHVKKGKFNWMGYYTFMGSPPAK